MADHGSPVGREPSRQIDLGQSHLILLPSLWKPERLGKPERLLKPERSSGTSLPEISALMVDFPLEVFVWQAAGQQQTLQDQVSSLVVMIAQVELQDVPIDLAGVG